MRKEPRKRKVEKKRQLTKKTLVEEYVKIQDRYQDYPGTGLDVLKAMKDRELFIFIVARTVAYGRSLKDSVENAEIHLRHRNEAEESFSRCVKGLI